MSLDIDRSIITITSTEYRVRRGSARGEAPLVLRQGGRVGDAAQRPGDEDVHIRLHHQERRSGRGQRGPHGRTAAAIL